MVAFNCAVAHIREDNGYCLASQPHPPQFVLWVVLRITSIVDYTKGALTTPIRRIRVLGFAPIDGDYHDDALPGGRPVAAGMSASPSRVA